MTLGSGAGQPPTRPRTEVDNGAESDYVRQLMARPSPITTKPGRKADELVVHLPPAWELRLRRVLRTMLADALPDARAPGLTPQQREARIRARRRKVRDAMCQYVSDLVTADVVGKEIALGTRSRAGTRRGSLREHVQAILRDVAGR